MWDFIAKYWLETLFGLIIAGLSWAYGVLAKKFKAEKAKNAAIENGLPSGCFNNSINARPCASCFFVLSSSSIPRLVSSFETSL